MAAQAAKINNRPGGMLSPDGQGNGKRGAFAYVYSLVAHGLFLLLVILLGGLANHQPPIDTPVSIEIVPGGGGGGGGGSTSMGANAGMIDESLEPGVQQDNVKPIDNEPVTARTQDASNQRVPVDINARRDAANATNATRPQDAESRGQTQTGANSGTTGTGGGNGNGNGTGTGPGSGSGTGGGSGSGNGTGTGSGTGPGEGSGSGGGKGNFPVGTFDIDNLDCPKSDAGDTSGQSKTLRFVVSYKEGAVRITPNNKEIRAAFISVKGQLDAKKTYEAVVTCNCLTGVCRFTQ